MFCFFPRLKYLFMSCQINAKPFCNIHLLLCNLDLNCHYNILSFYFNGRFVVFFVFIFFVKFLLFSFSYSREFSRTTKLSTHIVQFGRDHFDFLFTLYTLHFFRSLPFQIFEFFSFLIKSNFRVTLYYSLFKFSSYVL